MAGYIILLYIHVYHKWRSCDVWFLKDKVQQTDVLSFRAIFCPFSSLTTRKIKILKLKKAPGDIIILHICTINDSHMMYGSWDMERNRQFFVILDRLLPFYPSFYGPRKSKFWKSEKNTWKYYHFTSMYHK